MTITQQNVRLERALALHRSGDNASAEHLYREVLRLEPRNYDALYFLAVLCNQSGRFEEAQQLFREAILSKPNPDAYVARGYALQRLERHEEALACYDSALKSNPGITNIALARGIALSNLRRHDEALAQYDRAVAARPADALAWHARGGALLELGRNDDALQSFDKALRITRDNPETWRNRALALSQLGRPLEALDSVAKALALAPGYADALIDQGNILMRLRRHGEALVSFDRAIALRPEDIDLLYNRANALLILKRYDDAISAAEKVLSISPDYPYARGVLIDAKLQSCDWNGIDIQRRRTAEAVRNKQRVVSPFNFKALSDSPSEQLACARLTTANEFPPSPTPLFRGQCQSHDRIRLAYVSGDLGHTVVASLCAGLFENHDRSRFETFGISFGADDRSAMRDRLCGAFDRFLDVKDKSDFEIAAVLNELQCDIVVDLMGSTGNCRTGIFAHRPCGIQVNFLGFAGSMGAPYFDYIVADRIVIPEADRVHYDEQVVYLPCSYMPHDSKRPVSPRTPDRQEAGLPDAGFVFCSFNGSYKFTPEIFDIWMRLLRTVQGSVLWLPRSSEAAMRNLRREAQQREVAAERLIFAPQVVRSEDHLARLRAADLFLDTLPYNAHATASDALWAGLPVLTCAGRSFASRVAASLLHAAGLPELVADSLLRYEELALELARDAEQLRRLREKLARQRVTAPLFDTVGYTRSLESAYIAIWKRHQRREAPAGFAVGGRS